MTRLLLAIVCTLALAGITEADYSVGYAEDGYTYSGEGLWAKGDTLYTRTYHEYTGYTNSYNGYGYYVRTPQAYYYWSYSPQLSPKSTDAEWIAWARERERKAANVASNDSAHRNFIEKLTKFGITPPPPGMQGYYGEGSFLNRQAYVPPIHGQTVYGSYTIRQDADLYLPVDPNAAIQALSLASKWSLDAAGQANQAVAGATGQVLQSNERIALAREERLRQEAILKATQPPSRITTTVTGVGPVPVPAVPAQPAAVADDGTARLLVSETAKTACVSCHSGAKASGGLDITKPLTASQHLSIINRVSLPLNAKGHMPAAGDGQPAVQMNASQIADLLPKPEKPVTPKPQPEANKP